MTKCGHDDTYGVLMKTIAILSRKGGAGKTTLAVHLSVAAERAGHTTAMIDLDPQESAMMWKDIREFDTPSVISAHAPRLPKLLEVAEQNGATLTILDTAPYAESVALAAAREATIVLIPCRPAALDLRSIRSTIDIVRLAKVPAVVILNAVPAHGDLAAQARQAIANYGIPCAPHSLGHRIAFSHAITDGLTVQEFEPKGKASNEVHTLYEYLANEMEVAHASKK